MRKYGRTDENQTDIVQALRKAGCRCIDLSAVGNGCPDILAYRNSTGLFYMLELKDGDKYPSQRKLTPHQVKFHEEWPVSVVKNIDEALQAVGLTFTQPRPL
jgi:Holliday junction resolvase